MTEQDKNMCNKKSKKKEKKKKKKKKNNAKIKRKTHQRNIQSPMKRGKTAMW